ncbi:MATE family efflux transporter [Pseudoalteromonas fenneropenaei]
MSVLVALIFTPLLTRELHEDYGKIALFLLVTNLVMSLDSNRVITTSVFIKNNCKLPLFNVAIPQLIYFSILIPLFFLVEYFYSFDGFYCVVVIFLLSMFSSVLYGTIDGMKKVVLSAVIKMFFWFVLFSLLYIYSLKFKVMDYIGFVFVLAFFVQFFVLVVTIFFIKLKVDLQFNSNQAKSYFYNLIKVSIFNLITIVLSAFDRLLINYKVGSEGLAYYSVQSETILKAGILYRTITSYLYPRLIESESSFRVRIYNFYFLPVSVFIVLIFLFSNYLPFLFEFYSGFDKTHLGNVAIILSMAFAFSWYGFAAVNLLNSFGDFSFQIRFYLLQLLIVVTAVSVFYDLLDFHKIALLVFMIKFTEPFMYVYISFKLSLKLQLISVLNLCFQIVLASYLLLGLI